MFFKLLITFISLLETNYLRVTRSQELKALYKDWYKDLLPPNYNKHVAPSFELTKYELTQVNCEMNPISIIGLSAKTMDMRMELAFYISWKDHRLNTNVFANETNPRTIFPKSIALEMWFPLLNFGNCKACIHSTLYKPIKETLFYNHIRSESYSWTRRVDTFICQLAMARYPFDKQTCSVEIKSFANQPLIVNYTIGPHNLSTIVVPPEFELYEITSNDCPFDPDVHNSCHSYNFSLRRTRARHVLLIFIPSMLIVIISWISFWVQPSNAAPRVALGLTSMLTLAMQFSSAQRDLPAVSITMALDVWMVSCIFTVFISLIEYAVVGYLEQLSCTSIISPIRPETPDTPNVKDTCSQSALISSFPYPSGSVLD